MVGADPGEQATEIRRRCRQANVRPWVVMLAALAAYWAVGVRLPLADILPRSSSAQKSAVNAISTDVGQKAGRGFGGDFCLVFGDIDAVRRLI
jgi:hypothetical protein